MVEAILTLHVCLLYGFHCFRIEQGQHVDIQKVASHWMEQKNMVILKEESV